MDHWILNVYEKFVPLLIPLFGLFGLIAIQPFVGGVFGIEDWVFAIIAPTVGLMVGIVFSGHLLATARLCKKLENQERQ